MITFSIIFIDFIKLDKSLIKVIINPIKIQAS